MNHVDILHMIIYILGVMLATTSMVMFLKKDLIDCPERGIIVAVYSILWPLILIATPLVLMVWLLYKFNTLLVRKINT